MWNLRSAFFLATSLTICAPGTAQLIGVKHITPSGFNSQISVWPSMSTQRVPPKLSLMPRFFGIHSYVGATSTLDTKTSSSPGHVQMQLKILAGASTPRGANVSISGDSLLTLTSKTPIQAILRVTLKVKDSGAIISIGSTSVTIPGQGKFQVGTGASATRTFRVLIDSKGFALTSTASLSVIGKFFSASASIDIDVQALSVNAIPYGKLCSAKGPTLSATPQPGGKLDLLLRSIAPNTLAGRLVGTRRLSVKLPGTSCWLNTDFVFILPFMTDAQGEHRTQWPIPSGVKLNVQDLLVQKTPKGPVILTTNGVEISRR